MKHDTTPACPHCGAPTKDTPLCRDAEQELHALLRRLTSTVPSVLRNGECQPLPDDRAGRQPSTRWDAPMGEKGALPRLLDEAVSRQTRFSASSTKVKTTTASRTPLPSKAGDRATRLHAVMVQAANDLIHAQMCVLELPLAVETTTAAEWLLAGFDRLRLHPGTADLYRALQAAVTGAEQAVDRPADRRYLGSCTIGNPEPCPGHLIAVGKHPARCTACGRQVDADERQQQLLDQAGVLLFTSREVERITAALGRRIPESNVRDWGTRGHIIRHGTDPTRYVLQDCLTQAEKIHERHTRRRTA